jgi:hypothetical protein
MKNKNKFIVELQGGLGNQLFGLAFAQYLSQKQQRDFVLSERQIDKGITKHGVKISDFDVQANFLSDSRITSKLDRYELAIERKWPFLQEINIFHYNSKIVGYDASAEKVFRNRYRGYFQSFLYGEALRAEIPGGQLSTKKPTNWLREYINKAVETKPIVMHIRRGDYFKVQSDFGLLSEDYYRNALLTLRAKGNDNPVWVFTDSPELVTDTFIESLDFGSRIIDPPTESTPAESLSLMQYGSANVISNSTFSWWPAFLSRSASQIICPSVWFKNMETPQRLIPEHWTQLESQWL